MGHWIQVREEMTRYQKVPSSPPFACFWDLSLSQETKSQQSMQDQNHRQKWSQLESCVWKTWVETYVMLYSIRQVDKYDASKIPEQWLSLACSTKMSKEKKLKKQKYKLTKLNLCDLEPWWSIVRLGIWWTWLVLQRNPTLGVYCQTKVNQPKGGVLCEVGFICMLRCAVNQYIVGIHVLAVNKGGMLIECLAFWLNYSLFSLHWQTFLATSHVHQHVHNTSVALSSQTQNCIGLSTYHHATLCFWNNQRISLVPFLGNGEAVRTCT